jgi:hypothetical protein
LKLNWLSRSHPDAFVPSLARALRHGEGEDAVEADGGEAALESRWSWQVHAQAGR